MREMYLMCDHALLAPHLPFASKIPKEHYSITATTTFLNFFLLKVSDSYLRHNIFARVEKK